mmetsp:Transcript_26322/g.81983  ORF Transcript_26322/g.81983 Transcript_26322/m.81983 type:complete len:242 (-) Transcript_26322:1412-2137(-)
MPSSAACMACATEFWSVGLGLKLSATFGFDIGRRSHSQSSRPRSRNGDTTVDLARGPLRNAGLIGGIGPALSASVSVLVPASAAFGIGAGSALAASTRLAFSALASGGLALARRARAVDSGLTGFGLGPPPAVSALLALGALSAGRWMGRALKGLHQTRDLASRRSGLSSGLGCRSPWKSSSSPKAARRRSSWRALRICGATESFSAAAVASMSRRFAWKRSVSCLCTAGHSSSSSASCPT